MSLDLGALLQDIHAAFPAAQVTMRTNPGPSNQHSLLVSADSLVEVMGLLRERHDFDLLTNVTGVDWPDPAKADAVAVTGEGEETPPQAGFLEVVYHLYSTSKRLGPLVVRARTADRQENAVLPSVVAVYRSADFQEREVFDLFGITFTGHPDLRRILMWDEFTDHPMRKDYVPPDDYEYEPTPHGGVFEKARQHYPA